MSYLTTEEILELLEEQGYLSKQNFSARNTLFHNYLEYIEGNGVHFDWKDLKLNTAVKDVARGLSYQDVSEELAQVLNGKIELFSDNYWALFDYYEKGHQVSWNNPKIYNTNPYDSIKELKKKKALKAYYLSKMKNLPEFFGGLTYYLENAAELSMDIVKLWTTLLPAQRDNLIVQDSYSFIERFDHVDDSDKGNLLKANIYRYFKDGYSKIESLYERKKGTAIQDELATLLKIRNPDFQAHEIMLFSERQETIYQNTFELDRVYFIQKYFVNGGDSHLYFKTDINLDTWGHCPKLGKQKPVASFIVKTYSMESLQNVEAWFKISLGYTQKMLFSEDYFPLIQPKNINDTLLNSMDFIKEYVKKSIIYDQMDSTLAQKGDKPSLKKNKI